MVQIVCYVCFVTIGSAKVFNLLVNTFKHFTKIIT